MDYMSNLNLYTIITIINNTKEYIIIQNSYNNKYTVQEIIRNKNDIYLGENQLMIEPCNISKIISFHNTKPNLFMNNKINQNKISSKDNYLMDQDEYGVENKGIDLEHLIEATNNDSENDIIENNQESSINDILNENTYNYTLIGGSETVSSDEELNPENEDSSKLDSDSEEETESSSDSASDIDPEDSSDDEESSQESSSTKKTPVKTPLKTPVKTPLKTPVKEEEELPSDSDEEEEIILEDILYEEADDTILIYEENLIPDSKIIANDKQQSDDIFNELIKMLPEKARLNEKIITQQKQILNNYFKLKNEFSIFNEQEEIEKKKKKGDNYKPLINKLKTFKKHPYYKPILNETKETYKLNTLDVELMYNIDIAESSEDSLNNIDKIKKHIEVHNKYILGENRLNYSLYSHINELYNLLDCYESKEPGNTFRLKEDLEVFSNTFSDTIKTFNMKDARINKHILLGNTNFKDDDEDILVKGNTISNIGYVKYPETHDSNILYKNNRTLIETINTTDISSDIANKLRPYTDKFTYISSSIKIGDNVNICIEKNFNIAGIVNDITETDYIIIADDENMSKKTLKFKKKDNNITISKTENVIKSKCYDEIDKDIFNIYLYKNETDDLVNNLNLIVPSSKEILENNDTNKFTSIKQFNTILFKYDLSTNDLTKNNFDLIETILNKNNKRNKLSTNFKEFENDTNITTNRKNFKFMNNKNLDELKTFYGKYPYFNNKLDSEHMRLKFIENQPDNGYLFYKTIVSNIEDKLILHKDKRIESIQKYLIKISKNQYELNNNLNRIEDAKVNLECNNKRLTNIYYQESDLLESNDTTITIDEDKIIPGEEDIYVKKSHYAILVSSSKKSTLFIRKNNKWEFVEDNIEEILLNHKEFCNQNGIGIRELNDTLTNISNCKYSEELNKCVSVEYLNLYNKVKDLNLLIETNQKNLDILNNSEENIEKNKQNISQIKHYLELEFKKKINTSTYLSKLYQKTEEIKEEEYQELYFKIDKYLENIAGISTKEYYEGLDILISKYGRKASEFENDNENKNNIYCRKGSKVICCKHHTYFIDYHKKLITLDELLNKMNEYGVESEGYIWCNNCGQVINMAESEVLEGFTDTGAHIITHEVIEPDEDILQKTSETVNTTNEVIQSLKHLFFVGYNKSIKEDKSLSIFKIMEVLLHFMGIKLTSHDESAILKQCTLLAKNNIKERTLWIEAKKSKIKKQPAQKILEQGYQNYKTRNIILYTTSVLFLYIQSATPPYIITKTHTKCKDSLKGYPLDKIYKFEGINYFSCLLEELRELGTDWGVLKKIKIKENLIKIIDMLKEGVILYRYNKRKIYDNERNDLLEEYKLQKYEWHEFKPFLDTLKINIDNLGKPKLNTGTDATNNLSILKKREVSISLKFMEELNNDISKYKVENDKFDPTPLDNFCCLEKLENSNYHNYFNNKDIETIIETLSYIENKKNNIHSKLDPKKVYIKSEPKPKFISFKNIDLDIGDMTDQEIKNFMTTYISFGPHKGEKYLFDLNDICILSNITKKDVFQKEYNKTDYIELKKYIKDKNYLKIDTNVYNLNDNYLNYLLENNVVLKENEYLVKVNKSISNISNKSNINTIIDDLIQQILVESKDIITIFSRKIKFDTDNVLDILTKLGETDNLMEANKESLDEEQAEILFYKKKEQLIKSYINDNLCRTIYRLKNKYIDKLQLSIPTNWKVDENVEQDYLKLLNDNEILTKFNYIDPKILIETHSILKSSTKYIKQCKGSKYTLIDYKMSSYLLHYIFLLIINKILTFELKKEAIVALNVLELPVDMDDIVDVSNVDLEYEMDQKYKQQENIIIKILLDIINGIGTNNKFLDKYSNKYIHNVIEKKNENDKESNLKFIQDLDRETWSSLKTMITLGMDTWKNLSSKNKSLYMPNNEPGEDPTLSVQETDANLRFQAEQTLVENYTNDQYNDWLRNSKEDTLAHQEMDVMPDDDEETT